MRLWPLLALLGAGCGELPAFQRGLCGNAILDVDEDCDTYVDEGLVPRAGPIRCGAASDELQACHFTCDPRAPAAESCPVGWGCGDDRVCRKPALAMMTLSSIDLDRAPEDVAYADFDGDGKPDLGLFDGNQVSVYYAGFGGFGEPIHENVGLTGLARSYGFGPVVDEIDGTPGADIVAPTELGLITLRGSRDRSFRPIDYPHGSLAIPFAEGPAVAVVALRAPREIETRLRFVALGAAGEPIVVESFAALAGAGPFARETAPLVLVDDLDGSGADDLVLGAPGGRALTVILNPGTARESRRTVALPVGTLGRYLGFGAVIAGERRAILAELREGEHVRLAWISADASGALTSPAALPAFDRAIGEAIVGEGERAILAAGDLNGDGRVDFLTSVFRDFATDQLVGGALVSTGTSAFQVLLLDRSPWSEAVVADLNHDASLDVAAATPGGTGITVLLGAGNGYNRGRIETRRAPELLRVGDFDGDFVADLAFFEASDEATEPLYVAFGRVQGFPEPATAMTTLESTMNSGVALARGGDLTSDLWVTSYASAHQRLSLYVFAGSSERRLRAPLVLAGSPPIGGLVRGDFDPRLDGPELVALGLREGESFIVGSSTLAGAAEVAEVQPAEIRSCESSAVAKVRCEYSTVLRVPRWLDGASDGLTDVAVRFRCGEDAPIRLFRPDGVCGDLVANELAGRDVFRAELIDVDAIGGPNDLLLVEQRADLAGARSGFAIHPNFRLSGDTREVSLSAPSVGGASPVAYEWERESAEDAVSVDVDLDGRLDVVVLVGEDLQWSRQIEDGSFAPPSSLVLGLGDASGAPTLAPEPRATGPRGRIFSADLNADGVPDLVTVRGRRISVLAGSVLAPQGTVLERSEEAMSP